MIARAVRDLPDPDSPARHSVSPAAMSKLTASSTGRRPSGVRASMESPSTARIGLEVAVSVTRRRCGESRRIRPSSACRRFR